MSAQTILAYDYPLLSAFWTMLWFFLWVMWFVLLFRVVLDVFRDDDLGGWAKAGWLVFCIALPFLGVLVYVVARGKGMGRREAAQTRRQQEAFDAYVRRAAAGGTSGAGELARLAELRSRGDLTDEEFARAKATLLADRGPTAAPGPSGPSGPSVPSASGRR